MIEDLIIGFILLFYGIIKLLLGIIIVFIPTESREIFHKIPYLHSLIGTDATMAGKLASFFIGIFGIYTILHAMAKFGYLSKSIDELINSKVFVFAFYGLIGLILMIFYYIVIMLPDIPISKDPKHVRRYIIEGLCAGLAFFVTVPIMILYYWHLEKLPFDIPITILCIITITICTYLMLYLFFIAWKDIPINIISKDVLAVFTIIMIPFVLELVLYHSK